jgi:mono/diheme cytochrome c family protein
MRKNPLIWIIVLGTIAALGGVAALYWSFVPKGGADATDLAQVATGKAIYGEQCASCHGVTLKGQPNWRARRPDGKLPAPPHDASGHTWHHADSILFNMTKRGAAAFGGYMYKTDMAPYAEILSDDEIWAVLAYIKSTWSAAIQRRQAAISAKSQ